MGSNDTLNGVLLKERTSAREGAIEAQDITHIRSSVAGYVIMPLAKPSGEWITTILFKDTRPVFLASKREIIYSGVGINERDLAYNNLDFVGSSFLHSTNLSRTRACGLQLERLNATILANGNATLGFDFKPTKDTLYQDEARSSGQSRLKYGQAGSNQLSKLKNRVTRALEGDDIFSGDYKLKISLKMGSKENLNSSKSFWLGCCYQGPQDIGLQEQFELDIPLNTNALAT
jgi:hypothetical protein